MHVLHPPEAPKSWRWRAATFLALSTWIAGLLIVAAWWTFSILLLPAYPLACTISLSVHLALVMAPMDIPPPSFVRRFLSFSLAAAFRYFPVTVVYEDYDDLAGKESFVIAFEPHSVLPQGICAFCEYAAEKPPPGLRHARILVSSAGFWAPVMRHLWWWLGCRPASRSVAQKLLASGHTIALCPGGVRECLYMKPGTEVAYLRKRHGFVRLALESGAPLVPVFAFGQSDLFSYVRPLLDWPKGWIPRSLWSRMARRIGYAPMIVWGLWGTAMPRQVPLTIVVGKPIRVPHPKKGGSSGGEVSPEMVEQYLRKFISELEHLFERHKKAAGYPNGRLIVY